MKPVKWWIKCQTCGCKGKATGSRKVTGNERSIWYRCKSGHRWRVLIEIPKARMAP